MAVQAQQYSSNFFFLNSNGQEANDWSLQPHQDIHFNFNKAEVVHSRKRSREVSSVAAAAPMNPPPPKPAQVIDLSELLQNHNREASNVVSTGLRLSHEQSQNQEQLLSSLSLLPGDLAGKIKRQRYELDRFIQTQGEELRRTLAENRENRYVELLCATEDLIGRRMREKDAELEKATRHHAELEARAAQLAEEARTWQLRAATREAEVSSLQAHLQQAIVSRSKAARQSTIGGGDGDAEEADDAESVYVDPERSEMIGPSCRICRRNYATVMALPCRHLVLCKGCDGGAVRLCPVCFAVKNSGVEVLFS
ncbi:E3 ubiquitin-protein ligase BOI [Cardamine amara subsp. amara]|uniref:E3 ubiquitin-protein ligase BOI n=1 Tax=Cardamine amara subsp. amara TaxID=228776 RepID=A0ABD1A3D7_CARAN